jgi:hypothetical protein
VSLLSGGSCLGEILTLFFTRFMGSLTNNSRKLANFAGFYKGIQSAGAAITWRCVFPFDPPKFISFIPSFINLPFLHTNPSFVDSTILALLT